MGLISDIFGTIGAAEEAAAYNKASGLATLNAKITKESTAIQETQASRQIFQTIGAQKAAVGGAGFAASGSAQDLLRSSVSQGALQKQVIEQQGLINENGYLAQAAAYTGQSAAATATAISDGISSIFDIFSDADAKQNITIVGPSHIPGINLYLFQYKGDTTVYRGVLAQEVEKVRPDAVERLGEGFLRVNYSKLGLTMEEV